MSYGTYSGENGPHDFVINGNEVQLEFNSMFDGTNDWRVAPGFTANIFVIGKLCGCFGGGISWNLLKIRKRACFLYGFTRY